MFPDLDDTLVLTSVHDARAFKAVAQLASSRWMWPASEVSVPPAAAERSLRRTGCPGLMGRRSWPHSKCASRLRRGTQSTKCVATGPLGVRGLHPDDKSTDRQVLVTEWRTRHWSSALAQASAPGTALPEGLAAELQARPPRHLLIVVA